MAGDGIATAGVVETEDADVAEVRGGDVVGFYEGLERGGGGEADMAARRESVKGGGGNVWLVVWKYEGRISRWTHVWKWGVGFCLDWILLCTNYVNAVEFLNTIEGQASH